MKKALLMLLITSFSFSGFAQSDTTSLLAHVDKVIDNWSALSQELENYAGLKQYCRNQEFRENVLGTLNSIHHYDTVIYNTLVKKQRFRKSKEIAHVLKDIKKFEKKYSPQSLLAFLKEECEYRRDIEKDRKNSKSDFGADSYDGQVTILESELYKYIKHITKLVGHIKEHSHHLHLEKYADQ